MATSQLLIDNILSTIDHLFSFARTADNHGSSWLFTSLVKYFDEERAAVSVTFPIVYNTGETARATIDRNGNLSIE